MKRGDTHYVRSERRTQRVLGKTLTAFVREDYKCANVLLKLRIQNSKSNNLLTF